MELMLVLLSLLGVIAYIALNYATKEPSHPQRDKLLAIYGSILIIMLIVALFIQWPIEFSWQECNRILCNIRIRCMYLPNLCS